MLERIVALVLRQKGTVIVFSLLLVAFGIFSYMKLPIDAFPDVTNIQVDVVGNANGLSALEIERSVTYPIEMSMRGLPKVKQLRSVTKFGLALVTIVFEDDVDIYFARQLVFERLAEAKENVPKGLEVTMGPIATAMGEIYQFTLEGKMPSEPEKKIEYLTNLRTMQEWIVNPLLKSTPGVNEINANNILPKGIRIAPYYDRADIVNASVGTVTKALAEAAILVMVILYILLRSFRASVVVLIGLFLSLLPTFVAMKLTGLNANLMSLGGLAISIGMIVDGAIIQVESVQRSFSEGSGFAHKGGILKAVLEVLKPSLFGLLIIALTFVPILALEGIEGKMFGPLAMTVAIALLSSLVISVFIIPVLCSLILKPQPEKESVVMRPIKRLYVPVLNYTMKRRKVMLASAGFLLFLSLVIIPRLGTEFIPVMDEGAFDMDVSLLPGVSLDKAMEINKLIAEKLKSFPELQTVVSRTGQTGVALDTRGVDKTGYVGVLRPKHEWKSGLDREELTGKMREALETIPGIGFGFSQPIQCRIDELVAGTRAQLIVRLFGEDMEILRSKADEIARILSKIEGVRDLLTEKVTGQPYLTVEIDRAKIARYGLNISDIQNVVEIAIAGKAASRLYEENRSFDITVRLPESSRNSVETIGNIVVPTEGGPNIPLSQLANISLTQGPAQISREDGLRRIGIEMNIEGRDMGGFVAEAKKRITDKVRLPAGYYITWGGQFENQQRAMAKLMIVGPVAIGVILLLLFATFRSIKPALLVILNLPFALIGGGFSLWISGLYLSVPASVGFIVLFGVAVLNGVVLVSRIIQLRNEEGLELTEAIIKGSQSRLRPVLMTASIAVFSLIPMPFAGGTGAEIQRPLATVVVGGLITSTLLTLLLIPSMYGWFEKKPTETEM